MLMEYEVNPFDGQEAKPYKNDPEILAMTNLIVAYQRNEIIEFEKILKVSEVKGTDVDSSTALAFYNALTDVLWNFGQNSDDRAINIAISSASFQPFIEEHWRSNQQYIINTERKRATTILLMFVVLFSYLNFRPLQSLLNFVYRNKMKKVGYKFMYCCNWNVHIHFTSMKRNL